MCTNISPSDIPLVSVLISAYNHELYIEETIRSLIGQTYKNIELIVIDDGSKDSTWQKLQEMRESCEMRFQRVVIETQENKGTCINLNKLVEQAHGKYIFLIASDDVAKPDAIGREVVYMETHPDCVLVVGDNEIINSKSERIGWDKAQQEVPLEDAEYRTFGEMLQTKGKCLLPDLYGQFLIENFIPNGALIRAEVLKKFFFTPAAPLEDHAMHLYLSKQGTYGYIDEILFSYRWHKNNTIKKRELMQKYEMETFKYEESVVESLQDKKYAKLFHRLRDSKQKIFSLGYLFKLIKVSSYCSERLVARICDFEITLYNKTIKIDDKLIR